MKKYFFKRYDQWTSVGCPGQSGWSLAWSSLGPATPAPAQCQPWCWQPSMISSGACFNTNNVLLSQERGYESSYLRWWHLIHSRRSVPLDTDSPECWSRWSLQCLISAPSSADVKCTLATQSGLKGTILILQTYLQQTHSFWEILEDQMNGGLKVTFRVQIFLIKTFKTP